MMRMKKGGGLRRSDRKQIGYDERNEFTVVQG